MENEKGTAPETLENNSANTENENQERTFTQDELNCIVQKRLAKEREKIAAENSKELDAREQMLRSREMNILTREKLLENNMPMELADIINVSEEGDIEKAISTLKKYANHENDDKDAADNLTGFRDINGKQLRRSQLTRPKEPSQQEDVNPYRKAMGLE